MQYFDGTTVVLGDHVSVPIPGGTARARVVMIGDTYEHLPIDESFLLWVTKDRVLEPGHIVIEWLGDNPFADDSTELAPVGNYMFSPVDEWVTKDA